MTDKAETPAAPNMEAQIYALRVSLLNELSKKYNQDLAPFLRSLPFHPGDIHTILGHFMTGMVWANHVILNTAVTGPNIAPPAAPEPDKKAETETPATS